MAGTTTQPQEQPRTVVTFFAEEATRQILLRIANVFNDPDLCDVTFIVGDDHETKEEICAPSQFMAITSPYFKRLLYPRSGKHCVCDLTVKLCILILFKLIKK